MSCITCACGICGDFARHSVLQGVVTDLDLNVQSAYKRGGTGTGNSHFFESLEFARQRRTNKMAAKTNSRLVHDIFTLYENLQAVVRMLYLASYEP